jgi:transposase
MVSLETGYSPAQVRTIFKEKVSEIAATVVPETPRVLGLDEVYLRGKPRCILTDIERSRPLDLLPKSNMLILCEYLLHLPERHGVEVVIMDFWRSRFEVVQRVLPGAAVVINKWAVLQVAQRAALRVLKKVRAGSNDSGLIRPRYSLYLRANYSRLSVTERAALAELFEQEPELREAYRLRQEFWNIWKSKDRQKAENQYEQWIASVTPELHYAFGDVLETVNRWHPEVFNYFDHPFTNAYTESVGYKLRSLSANSSIETARAKVLYGAYAQRNSTAPTIKLHPLRIRVKKAKPKARRASAPQKWDKQESEGE